MNMDQKGEKDSTAPCVQCVVTVSSQRSQRSKNTHYTVLLIKTVKGQSQALVFETEDTFGGSRGSGATGLPARSYF